jgi:hypothetical protein
MIYQNIPYFQVVTGGRKPTLDPLNEYEKSTIIDIEGSVYKNKIYNFGIDFEDPEGKKIKISSIDFSINMDSDIEKSGVRHDLILNNENIKL